MPLVFFWISVPPTVTVVPDERKVELALGDEFQISCLAEGKPKPTVTWTKVRTLV